MVNRIVKLLIPFLLRTLIIFEIGIEYLGLDGLFVSVLQVLNIAELGFSSAIVFSMYKPLADKDTKTICALLLFYKKSYHFIGYIVLVLGLIIIPFLPKLVAGSIPTDINIYILYAIYLGNAVLGYFFYAYNNSLLIADQRNDVLSNLDSMLQILKCIIQIFLVFFLHDYYAYIIVLPIFTVINNLLVKYITSKNYPMYICAGELAKDLSLDIKKRVAGLMIYRFCSVSRNGFDNMFLSAYLGLSTVAIYNNYYLVLTGLTSVMGVVSQSISASVGNSIATESVEKNYADFELLNFIYMLIAGGMTILLFILYQPFILLWLGKAYVLPLSVVIVLSIYFFVLKMGDVRGIYNDAAGLWWEQRYRTIIEAVANVVLNFVLINKFGVMGVVLASLISLFVVGVIGSAYVTFKCYFGYDKLWEYLWAQMSYLGSTIILTGLGYFIIEMISPSVSFIGIGIRIFICFIVYIIGTWLVWHHTNLYSQSQKFMRKSFMLIKNR
jgi:O-antigen/teichoic acid export membrane protein